MRLSNTLALLLFFAVLPAWGGLVITSSQNLVLLEEGGAIQGGNLAVMGTAFAQNEIGVAPHATAKVNDGTFGNSSSWIAGVTTSFVGVSLGGVSILVNQIAFGRDNTGTYPDRCLGVYELQYTTVANPNASTPEGSWTTIGTLDYQSGGGTNFASPALRHRFSFTPVFATGLRLKMSGFAELACVDELEAYAAPLPSPTLVTTGGTFLLGNLATAGTSAAFAKDVIGVLPHAIPNLRDGGYGNASSWIGGSTDSFIGIRLGGSPVEVNRLAFGRDNTGTYADRHAGTYTFQYTTAPNPDETTPDASWTSFAQVVYPLAGDPTPALRHVFSFATVSATGIRVRVQSAGDLVAVDELELYAPAGPPVTDAVWTGAATTFFSTVGNWASDMPPDATRRAVFSGAVPPGTVLVDAAATAKGMLFDGPMSALSFTLSAPLTLGSDGLVNDVGLTQTFTGPSTLTFSADCTIQAGAGDVTSIQAPVSTSGRTLIIAGTGQTRFANVSGGGNFSVQTGSSLHLEAGSFMQHVAETSVTGAGALVKRGFGTHTLRGSFQHTGGTTVMEGVLQVGSAGAPASIGGTVQITSGATLRFRNSTSDVFNPLFISGSGTLSFEDNGPAFYELSDPNIPGGGLHIQNSAVRIKLPFSSPTYQSSFISGNGTLEWNGSHLSGSSFTLSGFSTFTGNHILRDTTLTLSGGGSAGSSTITVESGATLSGSETMGAGIVRGGGRIEPGSSGGIGSFTFGGLTLEPTSQLRLQIGGPGDSIQVNSGVITAPSGSVQLHLTPVSGFGTGEFVLIEFAGATPVSLEASDFGIISAPSNFDYSFRVTSHEVRLVVREITGLYTFRSVHGLAMNGAQDGLTPAGDGVANVLKFAFNMIGGGTGQTAALSTPNRAVLTAGGAAGLPYASSDGTGRLQVTFIRRKNDTDIAYTVEFSDDLLTWAVNPAATTAPPVDVSPEYERVTVADSVTAPGKRFVRVKVVGDP